MSRRIRFAGIVAIVLAIAGCVVAAAAVLALRHVDPFYAAAVNQDPHEAAVAGRQLEERIARLNAPTSQAHWEATFTEEEVNGWLAAVLKEKLPDLLPSEVEDPRVALANGRVLIGYRYAAAPLTIVVTLETEPRIDKDGVVTIRLVAARAGLLPVAHSVVVDEVNLLAEKLEWPVEWRQEKDLLELVVPMRNLFDTETERRSLDEVKLSAGEIVLGGAASNRETPLAADAGAHHEPKPVNSASNADNRRATPSS
jgi:hypothetical protein